MSPLIFPVFFPPTITKPLHPDQIPAGKNAHGEVKTVTEGDPLCQHQMKRAEWDEKRFGPNVTNYTEYRADWHELFRCAKCGREQISTVNDVF